MSASENDMVVGPTVLANGVSLISLDFFFEDATQLQVFQGADPIPLTLGGDYTVAGAGTNAGSITLTVPADGTDAYSVFFVPQIQRTTDFPLRGDFQTAGLNSEQDRFTRALQYLRTQISRALRVSPTSPVVDPLFSQDAAARADRSLIFSLDGTGLAIGPTGNEIAAAQGYAEEAAAQVVIAADQVGLAAAQVGLATAQVGLATAAAVAAAGFAGDAEAAADEAALAAGNLGGIAALATNGLIIKTGTGTAATRTITPGSGIGVAQGDGVAGDPTISFNRAAPILKTADFSVGASENWLVNNKAGSACVVTLPAAGSFTGREIMFQNLQAQQVNSASSNVIPLAGGSAAAAILPAVIGATATLVSDGTSWRILALTLPGIGEGQTWQNVTGSRALGVDYTNNTGRPIQVSVTVSANVSGGSNSVLVAGNTIGSFANNMGSGTNIVNNYTFIVPAGATYRANASGGGLVAWWELF